MTPTRNSSETIRRYKRTLPSCVQGSKRSSPEPRKSSKPNHSPRRCKGQRSPRLQGLSALRAGFGSAISALSAQLTAEATKLAELQRGIAAQTNELKELHGLEVTAQTASITAPATFGHAGAPSESSNAPSSGAEVLWPRPEAAGVADAMIEVEQTLDELLQKYTEESERFDADMQQQRQAFGQEMAEQRGVWQREQEAQAHFLKERDASLQRAREREAAEYAYERSAPVSKRRITTNNSRKKLFETLDALVQRKQRDWEAREKALADQEKLFAEYQAQVEVFPAELDAAVQKAAAEVASSWRPKPRFRPISRHRKIRW